MTNEERPATETDRLITRLIDREASGTERDRFERLAEGDASLWRDLAVRQFEMGLLADRVPLPFSRISSFTHHRISVLLHLQIMPARVYKGRSRK